ncbi:hypothetical protein TNCV_2973131 [Trichonephila clavipes]|nr:hypothetical protein TNCV_2973131 [Trichonephila clavipes]
MKKWSNLHPRIVEKWWGTRIPGGQKHDCRQIRNLRQPIFSQITHLPRPNTRQPSSHSRMNFFITDFVSKCLIATPSLYVPKTNQVVPSPPRTATPSGTIDNYDMGWRRKCINAVQFYVDLEFFMSKSPFFPIENFLSCFSDRLHIPEKSQDLAMLDPKAAFTPRKSASSIKRLANQKLYLGRDEVSDWLDAQLSTPTALV